MYMNETNKLYLTDKSNATDFLSQRFKQKRRNLRFVELKYVDYRNDVVCQQYYCGLWLTLYAMTLMPLRLITWPILMPNVFQAFFHES